MRLIGLAGIALLAVSTLTFADSFDFQGSGSVTNGTAQIFGRVSAGRFWGVRDQLITIEDTTTGHIETGVLGTITILSGTLATCSSGFCFDGGKVDVDGLHGEELFQGTFTTGTISLSDGTTFLNAKFPNGAASIIEANHGKLSTQVVTNRAAVVAEPASLVLVGTGMLGLAILRKQFHCSGKS